jgi:hypothetical protein
MDNGISCRQEPQAAGGKGARAPREMRVSQERDQKRSGRNSPFR